MKIGIQDDLDSSARYMIMKNKAKLPYFKLTDYKRIILLLIFFAAIILRFWKVPELFFFGIDEEYQSLLALTIVKDFHIIWIGLSAANTGFYVGPLVVYIHAFLLWISKLDPVILGYAGSVISVITITILFFTVRNLFNQKIALISSLLYASSAFIIAYDRRFWNSTFVPITSILLFLSLVKSEKNPRWYILTAILLALSFHINASLFVYIPIVIFIVVRRLVAKKILPDIKTVILSIIAFAAIYSPLIVFDLVHKFDNLKTPLRILSKMGQEKTRFPLIEHLIVMKTTLTQFFYLNSLPSLITISIFIVCILAIGSFFYKKKTSSEKILGIIVTFYLLMFFFYPGKILDYYYLGFLPFFAMISGILLNRLPKVIILLFFLLFITLNVRSVLSWPKNSGLEAKRILIQETGKIIGKKSFYLETTENYLNFGGWQYLFEAYDVKPSSSQADNIFGWIYQKEISDQKPELKVVITNKKISLSNQKPVTIIKSGTFNAYIYENL